MCRARLSSCFPCSRDCVVARFGSRAFRFKAQEEPPSARHGDARVVDRRRRNRTALVKLLTTRDVRDIHLPSRRVVRSRREGASRGSRGSPVRSKLPPGPRVVGINKRAPDPRSRATGRPDRRSLKCNQCVSFTETPYSRCFSGHERGSIVIGEISLERWAVE